MNRFIRIVSRRCSRGVYYAIEYEDEHGNINEGYGSYDIVIVMNYKKEYFEGGRLIMTKQELKTKLTELEKEMADLKVAISKIGEEEPKFERRKGEVYYTVGAYRGNTECYELVDDSVSDGWRYDNNNYFYTEERAQEVSDKINFLLKLERLHDIYCPREGGKYYISQNTESGRYCYGCIMNVPLAYPTSVMFPSEEIAYKVCGILNKELEEKK